MKQKAALLAAILVWVTTPAAAAEESGTKPVASHGEEKTDAPAGGYKVDYKELFGCEPMGENGHMTMPRPASGTSQQGAMQPAQGHVRMQGEALK